MTNPTPKQERDQRHDAKRAQQNAARPLYKTARWLKLRAQQLAAEPLCRMCLAASPKRFTPANTCDHIDPHGGDPTKFWAGPFQSLCQDHHSGAKQREEGQGYSDEMGADGFPSDPRHPFNR